MRASDRTGTCGLKSSRAVLLPPGLCFLDCFPPDYDPRTYSLFILNCFYVSVVFCILHEDEAQCAPELGANPNK